MGEESSLARAQRALATAGPHLRRAVRKNRGLVTLVVLAALMSVSAPPLAAHILPGVAVVVAARDLSPGDTIQEQDLTTTMVRPDLVPEGAVRSAREIAGESAAGSISKGALVLREHLREKESALAAHRALVSIPIASGGIVDAAEPGTQLRIICKPPGSSEGFADNTPLTDVRAVLRAPLAGAPGEASPLAAPSSPMATVEIDRVQVSTIAHCTLNDPPFIAVVG
ncbi:SAF domain-containing protein [Dermabacter sp. Marseille-Q3180]|uniref:SAF domain-containing protein n=1 Tax=Dermabacter sp. Marseille-Q3180 TaxID=2758090 RepID=UPI002025279D|nr:SAF domain-containing protein [Dermabacter sp. Marseille-Q3180]